MTEQSDRSFQSIEEELDFYRSRAESLEGTLLDTQLALEEFQASSRELEEEMEKELERTEKINNEVKSKNETLRKEAEDWKVRKTCVVTLSIIRPTYRIKSYKALYSSCSYVYLVVHGFAKESFIKVVQSAVFLHSKFTVSRHDHNIAMMQMQREIDILKATEEKFKQKTLELELDNDDLERTERAAKSSLLDLEMKYNKAIERNVILENEMSAKDQLVEEVQRLKDELRDTNLELAILRERTGKQDETIKETEEKLSKAERRLASMQPSSVSPLTPRSNSPDKPSSYYENGGYTGSYSSRLAAARERAASRIPRTPTMVNGVPQSPILSAQSNSVKMVQEMVGRVKNLEARLQSCRSLVTPLLNTPSSYSTSIPIAPGSNLKEKDAPGSRPSSPGQRSSSPRQFETKYGTRRTSLAARVGSGGSDAGDGSQEG
ncbi:hypothetical protein BC937DRAFT_95257 [Endogone sp. FLAS-F59071]|nr:hypothetical protein BC937DRAFT_95257 [Endogone sp. FLAS-F59071]|eukprot:RUS22899.1 hypothetical protein BC937DRAFT_95257 [Endogone sp. FLAS-F59071]